MPLANKINYYRYQHRYQYQHYHHHPQMYVTSLVSYSTMNDVQLYDGTKKRDWLSSRRIVPPMSCCVQTRATTSGSVIALRMGTNLRVRRRPRVTSVKLQRRRRDRRLFRRRRTLITAREQIVMRRICMTRSTMHKTLGFCLYTAAQPP